MPFRHIPHKTVCKDLILKVFGFPNLIRRIQASVLMRMLEPQKGEVILDAGCGNGFFTCEVAKGCQISIGIDWNLNGKSPPARCKEPKVTFVKGDVQKLPFVSAKFDKILLSSVLQMVKDDMALLVECYRVLKKRGILVLSVPIYYIYVKKLNPLKPQLKDKFGSLGKAYYDQDEVIRLLQNTGFEITETEYSPKKIGSLIFEIGLYLWHRFSFPFFSPLLFPLLYPVAYLDHFANSKQTGNELLIKARKVS